jgi:hypothetical protein
MTEQQPVPYHSADEQRHEMSEAPTENFVSSSDTRFRRYSSLLIIALISLFTGRMTIDDDSRTDGTVRSRH